MPKLWLDLETYSDNHINCGSYKYAEKSRILLAAYAFDDSAVMIWQPILEPIPGSLANALKDPSVEIWAHNSMFDRIQLGTYYRGKVIHRSRWRCTLTQASAHGYPAALDELCYALDVPQYMRKLRSRSRFIGLFCVPAPGTGRPRGSYLSHPQEWAAFCEYAKQDIVAMRECHKRLPAINYPDNKQELDFWLLDQLNNDRGVTVDTHLARAALAIRYAKGRENNLAASILTDGAIDTVAQRDKLLAHIADAYGVEITNLRAATVEAAVNDPNLPPELAELLTLRLTGSKSSLAKYRRAAAAVCSDGKFRGMMQFCGASRTGRYSGKIVQLQNLPRPQASSKEVEAFIDAAKRGQDYLDVLTDSPEQALADSIRGIIVPSKGKALYVGDYSGIEARVLAWLAGDDVKLQMYRDLDAGKGVDPYKIAYAKAFNIPTDQVTASQRQVGKVMELALGYQGGVGAFITMAAVYQLDLKTLALSVLDTYGYSTEYHEAEKAYEWAVEQKRSLGLSRDVYLGCDILKRLWRKFNPAIVELWGSVKEAFTTSIETQVKTRICPKEWPKVGATGLSILPEIGAVHIQLPSGRRLVYANARIESGNLCFDGVNQKTKRWVPVQTYEGKLVENITQAVARDVMVWHLPMLEKEGFGVLLTVHDEPITEATPDRGLGEFERLLISPLPWSSGIPLAANVRKLSRYGK